jgi:hypothetical protein
MIIIINDNNHHYYIIIIIIIIIVIIIIIMIIMHQWTWNGPEIDLKCYLRRLGWQIDLKYLKRT